MRTVAEGRLRWAVCAVVVPCCRSTLRTSPFVDRHEQEEGGKQGGRARRNSRAGGQRRCECCCCCCCCFRTDLPGGGGAREPGDLLTLH